MSAMDAIKAGLAPPATFGLVLAGGLSTRMGGGDKGFVRLGERSLLARIVERLTPQTPKWGLSANGDPARFAASGLAQTPPVVVLPDSMPGYPGPLAGVITGLDHVALRHPDMAWLVTVPCDTPFLPQDLVERLHHARSKAGAAGALAVSAGRRHPVAALWPVAEREVLRRFLVKGAKRKLLAAADSLAFAEVVWPHDPYDPFFNINSPANRIEAEAILQKWPDA